MKIDRLWYDKLIRTIKNPSYSQLLNTFDWQIKRFEIMKRDGFKCTRCGIMARKQLRVHHKKYINNVLPWNHSDELMVTICDECHSTHHGHENLHAKYRKGLAKYIKNGCQFK